MPIILQHFLYLTFSNKNPEDINSGTAWPTVSPDWNVMPFCERGQLHQTIEESCKLISGKHGMLDKMWPYLITYSTCCFWPQRNFEHKEMQGVCTVTAQFPSLSTWKQSKLKIYKRQ